MNEWMNELMDLIDREMVNRWMNEWVGGQTVNNRQSKKIYILIQLKEA